MESRVRFPSIAQRTVTLVTWCISLPCVSCRWAPLAVDTVVGFSRDVVGGGRRAAHHDGGEPVVRGGAHRARHRLPLHAALQGEQRRLEKLSEITASDWLKCAPCDWLVRLVCVDSLLISVTNRH